MTTSSGATSADGRANQLRLRLPSAKKAFRHRNKSHFRQETASQMPQGANETASSVQQAEPASTIAERGLKCGVFLEALIIEGVLKNKTLTLFECDLTETLPNEVREKYLMTKIKFVHPFGDLFTAVNVVRTWCGHLQRGTEKVWSRGNGIIEESLRYIEQFVESRHKEIEAETGTTLHLKFREDSKEADEILMKIFLDVFWKQLYIFRGHNVLGYKLLESNDSDVQLHRSSVLHFYTTYPQFIICPDTLGYSENTIRNAVVVKPSKVTEQLEKYSKSVRNSLDDDVVRPATIDGVGNIVAAELKRRWYHGHQGNAPLQMTISKELCNGTPVAFKSRSSISRVDVFCLPRYQNAVRKQMTSVINDIRTELQRERMEVGYTRPESYLRMLICAGGATDQVLMPHQYRSVLVRETDRNVLTKHRVCGMCTRFGEVENIIQFEDDDNRKDGAWGVVVFKESQSVQALLSSSMLDDTMLVELTRLRDVTQKAPPHIVLDQRVQATIRVRRLPVTSTEARVTFESRRAYIRALGLRRLAIHQYGDKGISRCEGDRKGVLISGLPVEVTQKALQHAFYDVGLQPNKITFRMVDEYPPSHSELEKFRATLTRMFDKVTDIQKVNIRVQRPRPSDLHLVACVTFENQRTATSALDHIKGHKINGHWLDIMENSSDAPSITVSIQCNVYQVLGVDILRLVDRIKHKTAEVQCTKNDQETHIFQVFTKCPRDTELVLLGFQDILRPTHTSISKKGSEFLSGKSGKALLCITMAQTGTYIEVMDRDMYIYGPLKARSQALTLYKTHAADKQQRWFRHKFSSMELPEMYFIRTIQVYGDDLERFAHDLDVAEVYLDIRRKEIFYKAESEVKYDKLATLHGAVNATNSSENSNPESVHESDMSADASAENLGCCSACLSPPESLNETYILQICGHMYCRTCIQCHIKIAVESRLFPITCTEENCNIPVCIQELLYLAPDSLTGGVLDLTRFSLDAHMAALPNKWTYCFRPTCPGVVDKSRPGNVLSCQYCFAKVCSKCYLQLHHGTCEDFQGQLGVQQWFKNDEQNRRRCPHCQTGIEKIDGCNRVCCTACQSHICWHCMKFYNDMTACYDHLNKEHGGPY